MMHQFYFWKSYVHFYVQYSIIYNSQDMGTTQASVNEWMDKENVMCIFTVKHYLVMNK